MSKLNVDEIESNTTNSNVKVVVKNSDSVCEIKGATNDGTLQLNCSAQSHGVKLKAPPSSAGQNYTMILPDNQVAANKFFKVKSVTGTVGQLEYASEITDFSNLNANNLTSGNLPAARFPSPFPAADAGLQFISKSTVGATNVSEIIISGFNEGMYLLIGKNMSFSESTDPILQPRDASGNLPNSSDLYSFSKPWESGNYADSISDTSDKYALISRNPTHASIQTKFGFIAEISNLASLGFLQARGLNPLYSDNKLELYGQWAVANKRIYSLRIGLDSATAEFTQNTQILLYKYGES